VLDGSCDEDRLAGLGWGADLAAACTGLGDGHAQPVRVTRIDRGGWVDVDGAQGPRRARQHPRYRRMMDSLELPAVGDWGVLREDTGGGPPLLEHLLPRRTVLVRNAGGDDERARPQAVAANMETVLVVLPLTEEVNTRRLDRFLSIAAASGADVALALTKLDGCDDPEAALAAVRAGARGVPAHPLSARTGQGLDALAAYLGPGRTVALLGMSGVGKSTLVNRLHGSDLLATNSLRSDGRGRHTTTHRELVGLPGGGMLIDTPGVRSVGLWEESAEGAFDDIEALIGQCRFSDCAHDTEPACAVLHAMQEGALSAERWDSYRTLQAELGDLARRQEATARAAETRRARARQQDQREESPPRRR
jgi:ribosome biogenesis GTPase / thiamine phosphate phosphatase